MVLQIRNSQEHRRSHAKVADRILKAGAAGEALAPATSGSPGATSIGYQESRAV